MLLNHSFKFTSIQISWLIRLSSTILDISFDVLIKRRNYASKMLKNHSISNLGPIGIMMRSIIFASASWNSWGEWFLQSNFTHCRKRDPFRTDVASFFEPSVNCIIKAVLDQRKSSHKMISVSHVLSISTTLCYWQSPLPTLACCSRWRVCSEWLALQQSTRGIDPTWDKRSASWEPCVVIFPKISRPSWIDLIHLGPKLYPMVLYLSILTAIVTVPNRVSNHTYGNFCHFSYDPNDPLHTARVSMTLPLSLDVDG